MIVCKELGVVFFHNPHTAGRTVSAWLKEHHGGVYDNLRHSTDAPASLTVRIAVWRDPVERFQSMHEMKLRQGDWTSVDQALDVLLRSVRGKARHARAGLRAFIPQGRFFSLCGITHRIEFPVFKTIAELDCFQTHVPITGWEGKSKDPPTPMTSEQLARLMEFEDA